MLFGKIGVKTSKEEMIKAEPTFVYDDFEEVWESPQGIFIEMDAETDVVRWISLSIYIPELDSEEFEECNW